MKLLDTDEVTLTVAEQAADGTTIPKDIGVATWTEDSAGALITLTPSADGFSVVAGAVTGANGTATVSLSVVVTEPSDGSVKTFTGSDAIVVVTPAADVASISIVEGTPTPKP